MTRLASLSSLFRSLGPAVSQVPPHEAIRAGIGAFIGLSVVGLFLVDPNVDTELGLYLVAPFGASSVLLFAVPNSPLAQPWSAIVGNTVAALVSVAVCILVSDPHLRISLAVGLSIIATILCRAVHPPAGAVAMTAAMNPESIDYLGFWFALAPIGIGTVILVVLAAAYARLTGRRYPLRQFVPAGTHATADRKLTERLGLSEEKLIGLLERYRQSFNLGVEDLARLIGAAELQAAVRSAGPLTAHDIMSRDVITVGPETELYKIANLFKHHNFTSLPVVGTDEGFLGVIFQIHLIKQASQEAIRLDSTFSLALKRLLVRSTTIQVRARDIMEVGAPRVRPETPIGALLPMMSAGEIDAVPVLEGNRIVGIVTRTDFIASMARQTLRASQENI